MRKVPKIIPPKGAATNLRPAGAHKNPKYDEPRSKVKVELRKGVDES